MKTPQELKNEALDALSGNWAPAVVATIVYVLIALLLVSPSETASFRVQSGLMVPGSLTLFLLSSGALMIFFLVNLELGYYNTFRPLLDNGDNRLTANMFKRGFTYYWHKLGGMLLYAIAVTLGLCLFIIPGILLMLAYAMVPYILDEHPEMSVIDTLRASRLMMRGHKYDLFYFFLTFIGWAILSIITLGIGFFWLSPYYCTARAAFYMVPQFKPMLAVIIITGVAFGAESGFITGAMTVFVSNFIFGQGPWTPWQMEAAGIIGLLAGLIFHKKEGGLPKLLPLTVFGAVSALLIYGIIADTSTVFTTQSSITWQALTAAYASGFIFNVIHAAATAVFLLLLARPLLKKLERLRIKYGLLDTAFE